MKTTCKLIFVLFVSIIYTSCDNDSIDNSTLPSNELVAIQETLDQASPINYTISNNLNTKIDYGSGNYQLQLFTDGKMTSIEFFNDGVASGNATYTYDADDRFINSTRSFPGQNQNSESQYEYTGNQILATNFSLDNNGVITSENSYSFTLNDNNQIVHYQNEANTVSWNASYIDGNLTGFSANGYGDDVDGTATFMYSTDLASEPYQKERYRYGSEWRNNIMLVQSGNYAFKQLAELGRNYLTGYTYVVTEDPTRTITLSVDYEFDNLGQLTKQTKDKIFFQGPPLERVLTYQYE